MFEYLFFWFYQHYKKVNKLDDNPVYVDSLLSLSIIAMCAIQFLCVYSIVMIIGIVLVRCSFGFSFKYLSIPLIILLVIITLSGVKNKKHYKKNFNAIMKKYESNPLNNKLKGWMIFLLMLTLFLIPVVFSIALRIIESI